MIQEARSRGEAIERQISLGEGREGKAELPERTACRSDELQWRTGLGQDPGL